MFRRATPWKQEAYIKASNTDADDRFGVSVALSDDGSTLVVGAHHESSAASGVNRDQLNNDAMSAGAAYVFTRTSTTWMQPAYLKASNTGVRDHFGIGVAVSGDGSTVAVGADLEDSAAVGINHDESNDNAMDSGAVYVFTRAVSWTQQAYVKASNTEAFDGFGTSVALSSDGSMLAVSARLEDSAALGINGDQTDNSALDSGAVYLFARTGSWAQRAYVKASNTDPNDGFGGSLVLSADSATLSVGAAHEDSKATGIGGNQADNMATDAGAVYVFW